MKTLITLIILLLAIPCYADIDTIEGSTIAGGGASCSGDTKPAIDTTIDTNNALYTDLVAAWLFISEDETNPITIEDRSGNDYDATFGANFPSAQWTWQNASGGQGMILNGVGNATSTTLSAADNSDFDVTTNVTIAALVRFAASQTTTSWTAILAKGIDAAYALNAEYSTTENPALRIWHSGGTSYVKADTDIFDGALHSVVGVYNGTDLRIYVDGVLDCTPVAETRSILQTSDDVTLFNVNTSASPDGERHSVFVWKKALSAAEVLSWHNNPYQMFSCD